MQYPEPGFVFFKKIISFLSTTKIHFTFLFYYSNSKLLRFKNNLKIKFKKFYFNSVIYKRTSSYITRTVKKFVNINFDKIYDYIEFRFFQIKPFLHWIAFLTQFIYLSINVIWFSDRSFQVLHIFAFYVVISFLVCLYLEYLKKNFNKGVRYLLIMLFLILIIFLYSQIDYINAKFSVTFPNVRRFIDLNGYASYGGLYEKDEPGIIHELLCKFFRFVDRTVNWIYYFITGQKEDD